MLSPDDARLIDYLHGGFPLSDRPFAEVGAALGCSEDSVIERLHRLLSHGELTRFGPLFQIERAGGQFVLAALAAPDDRFDAIAAQVNALPEVAHNYRRQAVRGPAAAPSAIEAADSQPLNMWFVIGAETPARAADAIARIEAATGLPVFAFPKEREFFVELRLPITAERPEGARDGAR